MDRRRRLRLRPGAEQRRRLVEFEQFLELQQLVQLVEEGQLLELQLQQLVQVELLLEDLLQLCRDLRRFGAAGDGVDSALFA